MLMRAPSTDLRRAGRDMLRRVTAGVRMTPLEHARFVQASAPERLQHFLVTALYAVVAFNLFLLSDRYMVPDVFRLAVFVKLVVLTPAILIFVVGGFLLRTWWLQHMPPWLTESLATLGTTCVSGTLGIVMLSSHSEVVSLYLGGLIPILVFGNIVQRLRFRYALASSLFNLGIGLATLAVIADRSSPYKVMEVPLGMMLLLVAIYTLISNFNLEMDERQRFLQLERTHLLRDQLEQTQADLRMVSRQDPLTGLANRRRFDEYVESKLDQEQGARRLAVLLIDVDHFKAFNDRYGHPAGDQCLRLVASALQVAMRGQTGLLARWGGEEFAAVLPGTDAATAQAVGHEMCRHVEGLAMRHEDSTTASHVTISCGVAWHKAVRDVHDADRLLQQADAALYEAKARGRNRCVLAPGAVT